MGIPFRTLNLLCAGIMAALVLLGCRPETPVTSSITVDLRGLSVPVNKQLYGLTIEEINHAIDGGIYAEMIRNRSFEENVPPLNCPYDAKQGTITTPNGWSIPFIRPDSVPGWRRLSPNTIMWLDAKELINDKNRRSLLVSIAAPAYPSEAEKGGVAATGYNGIAVRGGEKYELSLFMKGGTAVPRTVNVFIGDSATGEPLSDVFNLSPAYEWRRFSHTFTASADADNAVLAITADSATVFWIDMVSLFPEKTWKGRGGGLREDLMEMIAGLSPRFVRFPGGSFVEGYTAGTYPVWRETVGGVSTRRNFWNVWGYGSTNGMGFHEFLQMCEDLDAEPVYVVNSGVTSQSRRPRYEDITQMDRLVQDALDAIAYANQPADSTWGAMRAQSGHPEPFHLRYVEIGSENYGSEYAKRFDLFRKAINEVYPDVTVIRSSLAKGEKLTSDWIDLHFHAGGEFLISVHDRYEDGVQYPRKFPTVFIGEFSMSGSAMQGTMRAAISEACFLLGAENSPEIVERLAYAPVLGNADYPFQRYPAISFDNHRAFGTPSYHMLKMLAGNRGDELLKARTETHARPQVTLGYAGIDLFDNSYDFDDVRIDGIPVTKARIKTGGWNVDSGKLTPDANRWNNILIGDPTEHDYTISLRLRRNKGSGAVRLRVRDNGEEGESNDHIALEVSPNGCELYRSSGTVRDVLTEAKEYAFESNRWYDVRIVCRDEKVSCFVDGALLHEAVLKPLPSLVASAAVDNATGEVLLKVVNTTFHEEKTRLDIKGGSIKNVAEAIVLVGEATDRNTFDEPLRIAPTTGEVSFPIARPMVYTFPPNSITILKLKKD